MIYRADRKLLFVKPKKVAGTSIEIALSCNAGDNDIVTPLTRQYEAVRYHAGGQFPVNWARRRRSEAHKARCYEKYCCILETFGYPAISKGNSRGYPSRSKSRA